LAVRVDEDRDGIVAASGDSANSGGEKDVWIPCSPIRMARLSEDAPPLPMRMLKLLFPETLALAACPMPMLPLQVVLEARAPTPNAVLPCRFGC